MWGIFWKINTFRRRRRRWNWNWNGIWRRRHFGFPDANPGWYWVTRFWGERKQKSSKIYGGFKSYRRISRVLFLWNLWFFGRDFIAWVWFSLFFSSPTFFYFLSFRWMNIGCELFEPLVKRRLRVFLLINQINFSLVLRVRNKILHVLKQTLFIINRNFKQLSRLKTSWKYDRMILWYIILFRRWECVRHQS